MGPRFLSFASTVDAFATFVGILVAIISAEVNAPAPAPSSETREAQEHAPSGGGRSDGDRLTADGGDVADDAKLRVDNR